MMFSKYRCNILLRGNIASIVCLATIVIVVASISAFLLLGRHVYTETPKVFTMRRFGEVEVEECEPLPPTDDDAKCGNRIADRKCCEYRRAMNNKDEYMRNLTRSGHLLQILRGLNATPGEFPHMVALGWLYKVGRKYVFMCGGSLISEKFVLTAAHCTNYTDYVKKNVYPEPHIVRMGSENINNEIKDRNRKNVRIADIITHPKYVPILNYYDIALLKLKREVFFTKKIHPACLSTSLSPTKFTQVNITGWGVTAPDSNLTSDHLQVATVNMFSYETCDNALLLRRNNYVLKTHQLCAGVEDGGIDACQGDSGGPIQSKVCTTAGSMHTIIGVTSMGHGCGLADSPGIYISVRSVLTWIENIVWPEEYIKLRGLRRY